MLTEEKEHNTKSSESELSGWLYKCCGCSHADKNAGRNFRCLSCGEQKLLIQPATPFGSPEQLAREIAETEDQSLWRYRRLIPVPDRYRSKLQVGMTPLLRVGCRSGVQLLVKDETRMPSCSTKDRASEVVLARARQTGCNKAIVASTGNAAASLSCLGAAHGLSVEVFVPATVPKGKLAQMQAHGASVNKRARNYEEALKLVQAHSVSDRTMDRTTGINPFTREGKKTCAFEIAEQCDWNAPNWVVIPVGDGNLLSGIWKGFQELYRIGLISHLPRLLCVQTTAAPAIHDRLTESHQIARAKVRSTHGTTIAESICVTDPQDVLLATVAIKNTNGLSVLVDDDEIRTAQQDAGKSLGLFPEPSSAAAFAGLDCAIETGRIKQGDTAVILMTGHGLKTCGS